MNYYWLLLIPYCTAAYAIHGGELITGVNRQVRNVLCAAPFGLVAWFVSSNHYDYPIGLVAFGLAYWGANMGFDNHRLWVKGMINLFPVGAVLLPFAYWLGSKTKNPPYWAEFISGAFYGIVLVGVVYAASI